MKNKSLTYYLSKYVTHIVVAGILIMLTIAALSDGKGVHKINEEAVYIAGEACVINMPLSKPGATALGEMEECIKLHKTYQKDKNKKLN